MRIFWLGLVLIGCGGGDGGGTSFEGIYKIDTWTRNPTACDAEGPALTMREPLAYVKNESFLGSKFVNFNPCVDLAACKADANDEDTIHLSEFGFEEGSDANGWTTHFASAFPIQGQCTGGATDTKLTISKTAFRIESKHRSNTPFPPTSDPQDQCPEAKVEMAAEGQPCDELEVLTGTFQENY